MINHGKESLSIHPGMRIAQMVIKPIYDITFTESLSLEESSRGGGGLGSSGE